MKILKIIKKSLFSAILLTFLLISPFFIFKNLNYYLDVKAENKKINMLTIWHCETHEGGRSSRLAFLKSVAREFEKVNSGVVVYVRLVEQVEMEELISAGELPDLLSFGSGVKPSLASALCEIKDDYSVSKNYLNSARVGNRVLALPYMLSTYVVITKTKIENAKEYATKNNINFLAGNIDAVRYDKDDLPIDSAEHTTYTAYLDFKNTKAPALVGTMRDVARLTNANYTQDSYYYLPTGYSNMAQYVGVCKPSKTGKMFIQTLLSDETQKKVADVGLFSVKENVSLYSVSPYLELERNVKNIKLERLWE